MLRNLVLLPDVRHLIHNLERLFIKLRARDADVFWKGSFRKAE